MKERILENWDQILKALETDYGVSQIIADTWIRNLSIYNIQNKKIYFYVDERLGEHGVDYIHSKGYDVYLLSALREFFGDSEIDIVIDQKVNYEKEEVSSHSTESHNASQAYYDAIQRSNLNSKYPNWKKNKILKNKSGKNMYMITVNKMTIKVYSLIFHII